MQALERLATPPEIELGHDDAVELIARIESLALAPLPPPDEGLDNLDYDALLALDEGLPTKHCSPDQIAALPRITYTPGASFDDMCSVCLDGFALGERLTLLACGHAFHHPCIGQHLARAVFCPNCRAPVE